MLKKILTGAAAALTLGGAVMTASTASAYPHYYGGYHRGPGVGAVVGAGVLGLAVGAALSGPTYYGPGYYYGPPPGAYYGPAYYGYYGGHHRYWRWDGYHHRYY